MPEVKEEAEELWQRIVHILWIAVLRDSSTEMWCKTKRKKALMGKVPFPCKYLREEVEVVVSNRRKACVQ